MAASNRLSARAAATTKPGRYCDGNGLWLDVTASGAGSFVSRFTFQRKVREMGLGSRNIIGLAEARAANVAIRKLVAAGTDPLERRRQDALAAAASAKATPTFGEIANALIAAKQSEWRNPRHGAQWRMTIETYGAPLFPLPVDQVDTAAVLDVLTPLWKRAPETASRLRGRIEAVLDAARAKGHIPRNEANPAQWRGHLEHVLPKRGKLDRGCHAAMPYLDVAAFVANLRECDSISALALEYLILTATRLNETLGARWDEFDLEAKVWTIPATRMKSGKQHRVPLSDRAMEIIQKMDELRAGALVFPGYRAGRPLAGAALLGYARKHGMTATLHGFRSAFRDWAGNETHYPREVCEAALAHATGGAVEQAYRRSDALEKRRALMDAWAAFCEPRTAAGNVVRLK